MKLSLIWRENIIKIMPIIGGRIEKELAEHSHGETSAQEYYRMLKEGQAQLWLLASTGGTIDLIAITRIIVYPSKKRLSVDLVIGKNLEEALPYLQEAEEWAAGLGCSETEGLVRPGMARKMLNHGFQRAYEVILRPIARGM